MRPSLKRRIDANPLETAPRVRYATPEESARHIRFIRALVWLVQQEEKKA